MLAAIHRLLRRERERRRPRITNFSLDRERHASPLQRRMRTTVTTGCPPKQQSGHVAGMAGAFADVAAMV
jgi:hypothetical protein